MLTKKPAVHWRMIEPLCVYDYVLSLFCINAFSGVCYYYYYTTLQCVSFSSAHNSTAEHNVTWSSVSSESSN
jgi:hypothetical protein